jgi:hypothetical protein
MAFYKQNPFKLHIHAFTYYFFPDQFHFHSLGQALGKLLLNNNLNNLSQKLRSPTVSSSFPISLPHDASSLSAAYMAAIARPLLSYVERLFGMDTSSDSDQGNLRRPLRAKTTQPNLQQHPEGAFETSKGPINT